MTKKLTIWSTRFTPAKGNHIVAERQCDESDALAWLKIFREDEPNVCFVASARKPKVK
ncbi:hypothetical protein EVC03_121 [Rhizobium phage RHph_Y5A]|nr:hypothetical protein EVC03_121 [Rhizobium phage RHph_Y5A]QIG75563.1 hypothetical protein EVC18_121 [Rhizobium phage RHph_Y2_4]